MNAPILQVNPKDNVLVALQNLSKGQQIEWKGQTIELQDDVPAKHKFTTEALQTGDAVIMYGVLVGKAQTAIPLGGLITTENLKHAADPYYYRKVDYKWEAPDVSKFRDRTFNGYHRSDGRVGTANYWLFIPTVFCENRNLDVIREALVNELGYGVTDKYKRYTRNLVEALTKGEDLLNVQLQPSGSRQHRVFPNVDGVKFLNHDGGCGGIRQDSDILGKLLAAYANHPNVGGVTILSLGCQHLQTNQLLEELKKLNPAFDKPLYVFEQQQSIS
ncbi:MAG TPA: UxaA family hydrolase, partial [Flavihumibacter sp.]